MKRSKLLTIPRAAARMLLATLLLTMTTQTAWADEAVTLSVDNDFDEGTAGHWFVNMPVTGTNTLTFSNSNITTFKVYDDGGKNGNYSNNCKGTLTLTAPTGYVLQLSGSINTESTDNLTVYDGSTTSDTKLLDAVYTTSRVEKSITATSTGNSMMLYFKSDGSGNYRGLDLTVTLVSTSEEFGITVNSATGGSVAASVGGNSATKTKVNDVVTLTATPLSGYMVSDIIVKDENNIPVAVSGGWYSNNQATFTMPGSAVTVTPSFTNTWTADGGLYVNMPATGTNTLTIPSGVQSFKVYDDGGAGGSTTNGSAGNYSNNCSGYLTLTAPTGYVLQLSGSITTEKSNDNLTVYNGNTTSATKLLDEVSSSKSRTVTTITPVVSSGQSMMLYFKSDRDVNYTGLDLTVTLVLSSPHSININTASGGTVTASVNNQSVTSARIEDAVTLTATPESGYVLSGISVTDGNSNAVDIDWSIWTNTATFTMPGSEVTVTPTFTNAKTADDGLNINMIETGEQTATIPAGVQSFHVDYDYSIIKSATSKLTMTAPEGYLLQLSGTAKLTGTGQAYFRVYDGDNVVNAPILINSSSSGNYSYTGVVSTGNVMTIYCWTSYTNNDRTWDLDVTVNVVNANTSNGVTISNSITNGQVVSDKNTANVNETVTLTATPAEGCVLQSISVTDGNGAISLTPSATDATWGDVSYYTANEFTFKMRSSDATVTATFMSKTDFYVNMPKTDQRDFTIPDGTTSFKVYDNSGKDGSYFTGDNGKLLLTAPEGYMMNVSGYVKLYYSSDDQDYLDIYDGNSTSATSLGRFKDTSGNNNTFTQTSVNTISSTNQMLLHFVTNDYGYAPGGGVYLTVTLVPKEYSITYNGVEGATFSTTYDSYTIESAAITLDTPSKTGYDFSGWYDNEGLTGDAVTTIAAGSTGDVVLWAKWKKLLTNYDITIADIPSQEYTGSALTPAVSITDGSTDITDQCDIAYTNNTNAGTATVIITAKAESTAYSGERTTTFTISPASVTKDDANTKNDATEDYTVTDADNAQLTGVTTNGATELEIPADVNGVPVTSIADGTFTAENMANVQSIDLSNTQVILDMDRKAADSPVKDVPDNTLIYLPAGSTMKGDNVIIKDDLDGYNCTSFVLTDTKSYSVPKAFTASSATLTREFTANQTCTVCLPYDVPAVNILGKIYTFHSVVNNKVTMAEDADGLNANVPYIFVPNGADNIAASGSISVAIDDANPSADEFTFKGIYENHTFTAAEITKGIYGFAGAHAVGTTPGHFAKAAAGAYIKGMRAYLEYTGSSIDPGLEGPDVPVSSPSMDGIDNPLPSSMDVILVDADGTTTNIGKLGLTGTDNDAVRYNLSGQRVGKSRKGIVVKNGKKVVIK